MPGRRLSRRRFPIRPVGLSLVVLAGLVVSADPFGNRSTGVSGQQQVPIEGVVVDERGEPVAGAEVALTWVMEPEGLRAEEPVRTVAGGRFDGLTFTGRAVAVMAVDSTRTRGAVTLIATSAGAGEVRLDLAPLAEVTGTVYCAFFEEEPTDSYVSVMLPIPGGLPARLVHAEPGERADFRFLLPPGDYFYNLYAPGIEYRRRDGSFTVRAGERLALGRLDLGVTNIARYYGTEPPPLAYTDARGVEPGFTWETWRGKWVLFYLFAYT